MASGEGGVLFTFLTFLFIGVILGLVLYSLDAGKRFTQTTVEVSVLNAINSKYDDLTDDIITLDQTLGFPSIQQRILPFTYSTDENSVSVSQTLPIPSGKLSLYFDLLNAYSIFVEDLNAQKTFDGVVVDLNVPLPSTWGGSSPLEAGFNILPQCLQYQLTDVNNVAFASTSTIGCSSFFTFSKISRIDVNVSLPTSVDDYNMVSCSLVSGCPHQDYNAAAGPYFNVQFFDSNCSNCALSTGDKNISMHYTGGWETITYSCAGSACESAPLVLSLGSGLRVSHGGTPAFLSMRVTFTEGISTFYYQDANYSTQKPGFNTYKSNVVVFPK
jgi:hypothetical protein